MICDKRVWDEYLRKATGHDVSLETLIEGERNFRLQKAESTNFEWIFDLGAIAADIGTDPGSTSNTVSVPAGGTIEDALSAANTGSALSRIDMESARGPSLSARTLSGTTENMRLSTGSQWRTDRCDLHLRIEQLRYTNTVGDTLRGSPVGTQTLTFAPST